MNAFVAAISLAVIVTVASGLSYDSHGNRHGYPSGNVWDSVGGGVWDSWGSRGNLGGRWNSGHGIGHRRYRRAAAYAPYNPYGGGVLGNVGGTWGRRSGGRLGRLGNLNSKWNSWRGY